MSVTAAALFNRSRSSLRSMQSARRFAMIAVTLVATASPALAQTAVRGTVRDSSGIPLASAHVIIAALNRNTTTNDSGRFRITGVPAGTYHIVALRLGFAPGHADVRVPASGPDAEVNILMGPVHAVILSGVQVTATPTGTDIRDVAQSTTEISGAQLSRGLGPSVAQSLSREPGISVRGNGPAAAPVIRGLSGERVLVLQDGERAGDLSATSPDHAVSIDPLTAQRIEVVRGPASLLYGNNALGGVVNVISNDLPTTIPSNVDGFIAGQTESATPGAGGALGLTVPLSSTVAIVGRVQTRNNSNLRMGGGETLINTYNKVTSGLAGIGVANGSLTGGVLGRGYRFDYGLPSEENQGAHIEGDRFESSGRFESSAPLGPFSSVRVGGTGQWYSHDEIEGSGEVGTSFNLRTQTLDVLGRTQAGRVSGAVGLSGLFRQYEATGEEALTPAAKSNGGGIFVYQEIPIGAIDDVDARVPRVQVGARFDVYRINSETGDPKFGAGRSLSFNNLSGSVGISVPVGTVATVALSGARAFRAPTVEELFSNAFHAAAGTYDIGNPDLKVETNQGIDGILRVYAHRLSLQFSGYASRVDNFIAVNIVGDTTVDTDDGPQLVPLNRFRQGDATLSGVEGRADFEVFERFVIGFGGDYVRGTFSDDTPLPFMPPGRILGSLRYDDGRWSFDGEVRHGFAQNRVPPSSIEDDPSGVVTEAYDLVNLSTSYTFTTGGRVNSITLRADNLLDEKYRDATSRIKHFAFSSGRNVSLSLRVMF